MNNQARSPVNLEHPVYATISVRNFRETAIELQETCPHWIDIEIFLALSPYLKEKYLSSFPIPEIILTLSDTHPSLKIMCLKVIRDCDFLISGFNEKCDCSKNYPKTLKVISDWMQEIGLHLPVSENKKFFP